METSRLPCFNIVPIWLEFSDAAALNNPEFSGNVALGQTLDQVLARPT
jgi:hypothetical protein